MGRIPSQPGLRKEGYPVLTYLLTALSVLELICILTVLFAERKNPTSSIAWILVLVFFPVIGFILYLFLGTGFKVNKRRKYRTKAATDNLYDNFILKHLNMDRERAFLAKHGEAARLLTYLEDEGEGAFTITNRAEVFIDGNDMFPRLLEDIQNATKHIHLLFYIFRDDNIGGRIISALTEKAKSGVEIRLEYDSLGSLLSIGKNFQELSAAGGKVQAFAPLMSTLTSSLRLNYRNHRKIVVIDGVIGYVGGMNVGDEYMGKDPRLTPWRDTHLRITGPAVWFLQERFLMDWCYAKDEDFYDMAKAMKYFPPALPGGSLGMQIVSSGPDAPESPIKAGLLTMFYAARKRIYVQTPYFAPDESILDALQIAARSGIDVRLMIPKLSDHWIVHKATYGYARQVLKSGVRIFMYDGFLHAKAIVVDGAAVTIGTTNMTNRSFTQNFEVNAFIYNAGFACEHERIFLADQDHSMELDEEWFANRHPLNRACYNFSRLLAPLI